MPDDRTPCGDPSIYGSTSMERADGSPEGGTSMRDGDKLVAWLREAADELDKAHAILDELGAPRLIPGNEPVECTLAVRIWLLSERERGN